MTEPPAAGGPSEWRPDLEGGPIGGRRPSAGRKWRLSALSLWWPSGALISAVWGSGVSFAQTTVSAARQTMTDVEVECRSLAGESWYVVVPDDASMGDIRAGLGFPAGKLFAEGLVLADDAPLPSPPTDGGRLIVHVAPVIQQGWWETEPVIEEPPETPSIASDGRGSVSCSAVAPSTTAIRWMRLAVVAFALVIVASRWPFTRIEVHASGAPHAQPRPLPASSRSHATLSRLALLAQGLDPVELPTSMTRTPNRTAIVQSHKSATIGILPWRSAPSGPSLLRGSVTSSPPAPLSGDAPPMDAQWGVAGSTFVDVLPLIWVAVGKVTTIEGHHDTESANEAPLMEVRHQWKHIVAMIAAPAATAAVALWQPLTKRLRNLIALIARRLLSRQHCERTVRALRPLGFTSDIACSVGLEAERDETNKFA